MVEAADSGDSRFFDPLLKLKLTKWRRRWLEMAVLFPPLGQLPVNERADDMTDLADEFYIGATKIVSRLPMKGEAIETGGHPRVKLDLVETESIAVAQAFEFFDQPNPAIASDTQGRDKFKVAASEFHEVGEFERALAALLNVWRLLADNSSARPSIARDIGYCLIQLGWKRNAAVWLERSADAMPKDRESNKRRADDYELAGLLYLSLKSSEHANSASRCFNEARLLHEELRRSHDASRCSVFEHDAERKSPRDHHVGKRIQSFALKGLWLYGESPWFVAFWIVVVTIVFAVFYQFAGFQINKQPIEYNLSLSDFGYDICDFFRAWYFSVVTFSTLGYGDGQPSPGASRFLAGCEALIGVILIAMFIVTMQRRFVPRG